jgi:hypothetical protein
MRGEERRRRSKTIWGEIEKLEIMTIRGDRGKILCENNKF